MTAVDWAMYSLAVILCVSFVVTLLLISRNQTVLASMILSRSDEQSRREQERLTQVLDRLMARDFNEYVIGTQAPEPMSTVSVPDVPDSVPASTPYSQYADMFIGRDDEELEE